MATYPTIAGGVVTQFPYVEIDTWVVAESSVPCGFSYTRPQHTTVLRNWILHYPVINSADRATLENFWNLMRGRWDIFDFTDDQGVTWPKTRFDMDSLVIRYVQPGIYSTEIHLSAEA